MPPQNGNKRTPPHCQRSRFVWKHFLQKKGNGYLFLTLFKSSKSVPQSLIEHIESFIVCDLLNAVQYGYVCFTASPRALA